MSDSQTDSNRRRFLKGTGAAAVSLGLAGCSQGGDSTPTDEPTPTEEQTPTDSNVDESDITTGGNFRVGMSQAPAGLNVLNTNSAYSSVILNQVFEYGTATDPVTTSVRPNVFSEWEFEELDETGENDQPNVLVRINVQDGLTFNDGSELSVSDVVFSYNYVMEQEPGAFVSYIDPITEVVESDGDWDVEMTLAQPLGTYDSTQLGNIPILAEKEWSDVSDYQQYQPRPGNEGELLGLGPGVVTRYEPDTTIEISYAEREGDYTLSSLDWREDVNGLINGGPFVDAIRIFVYGSQSALNQAFLNGELDTMYEGISPSSRIPDVEEAEGLSLVDGYDTGYSHYSFNLRNAPLDDITFRQMLGFAYDEVYAVDRLAQGYAQAGDFVMPPGYKQVRPDGADDVEVLNSPAAEVFSFRQSGPGVVDVEGVRSFLTEGQAVTGESGTFVGQDYPGSMSDVSASQTESKYDYSFGPVESDILADAETEQEIRVDGQTLTELRGGDPLVFYINPADNAPQAAQMMENFINQLQQIGIPVQREVNTFNTMLTRVYVEEDFDLFPMGWVNLSPFAVSTLYGLFHSSQADDHSEGNSETSLNNPMGYGLFEDAGADDLIEEARSEMDADTRNQLAREAVEKIYLDFPTMVTTYNVTKWPVNSANWGGFVGNIPGPGSTYLGWQFQQVHQAE
ncbi:ABC transporter substrate-binding protein [Halorarum halobium]|uniref:ABC transporter substrate-binding protein n=1 Tax=Halorarum halobium TaxID=3075121 RepID=UPI0028A9C7DC|nr:ABC transporter substrate-binding protein [Halobaculum sp. XH14]